MPDWSTAIPCHEDYRDDVPDGPVIYRLRVASKDHSGWTQVPRCFATDKGGTLLIGEGTSGSARFWELANAVRGVKVGRGHGPGFTFYTWYRWHFLVERLRFDWFELAPAVRSIREQVELGDMATRKLNKKVCEAAELLAMYHYWSNYGELPPVNLRNPNYNAVAMWLKQTIGVDPKYAPDSGRLNVPIVDVPGIPAITLAEARRRGLAGDDLGHD